MKKEFKATDLIQNNLKTATIILGIILLALLITDTYYNEKQVDLRLFNISSADFNNILNISMGFTDIKICELKSGNCVIILKEEIKKIINIRDGNK